jgi:hypothetical protein
MRNAWKKGRALGAEVADHTEHTNRLELMDHTEHTNHPELADHANTADQDAAEPTRRLLISPAR